MSLTDQHSPFDGEAALGRRREVRPATVTLGAAGAPSQAGQGFPLGATVLGDGVNFSVYSRQASRVDLLLFDDAAATQPVRVIELDARRHRTYHYWHVFVPGIRPGQIYAYRAAGPFEPERGLRFDPAKVLLDPYGRAVVVPDGYSRRTASRYGQNNAIAMKSVVVDPDVYDWEGDAPLRRPFATVNLRDTRRQLHAASELWGRRGAARDLCGHDRENPILAGSRDYRGRAASRVPV